MLRIFCFLGTKLCTNILCYKIRILGVWRDVTGHARSYLDINNNNNSHKNSRSTTWTKRTLKARAGKGVFPKIKAMCCLRLARQGSNLVYTEPIASDTLHVLLLLRNRNSLLPLIWNEDLEEHQLRSQGYTSARYRNEVIMCVKLNSIALAPWQHLSCAQTIERISKTGRV